MSTTADHRVPRTALKATAIRHLFGLWGGMNMGVGPPSVKLPRPVQGTGAYFGG